MSKYPEVINIIKDVELLSSRSECPENSDFENAVIPSSSSKIKNMDSGDLTEEKLDSLEKLIKKAEYLLKSSEEIPKYRSKFDDLEHEIKKIDSLLQESHSSSKQSI
ncbi:hypothetical protein AYI70_g10612 [Smittium culicis]|uniref:Uncharacterized protein n=1 Tax=Smittium culicis TaxID=133412 RepID=A0A1R1X5Q6_9FUNG|nr:hypothetical protein AYI70_g10612 [Smittium culicis]